MKATFWHRFLVGTVMLAGVSLSCSRDRDASRSLALQGEEQPCSRESVQVTAPRRVVLEGAHGIVIPPEAGMPWLDNQTICEFESGFARELRRQREDVDIAGRKLPRRYMGFYREGKKQLNVVICLDDVGWDDFPSAMDHPPWLYAIDYDPAARSYFELRRLRDGMDILEYPAQ